MCDAVCLSGRCDKPDRALPLTGRTWRKRRRSAASAAWRDPRLRGRGLEDAHDATSRGLGWNATDLPAAKALLFDAAACPEGGVVSEETRPDQVPQSVEGWPPAPSRTAPSRTARTRRAGTPCT
ncbi:hypothetical protein ACFQXA_01585 [Nocardiopsis composta]